MRARPVFTVAATLTIIMAGSSHAPPPSYLTSLFPDDAWERCCDAVKRLYEPAALRGYRIYVFPEIVAAGFVVRETYGGELPGPDAESWLFFVDEVPPANWGHPCRVIFVTTATCELVDYKCQFPPANVDEFRDVTEEARALLGE